MAREIITGGLGGIGRAIAKELRDTGAKVAARDLRADHGIDDEGQETFSLDVTNEASVQTGLVATLSRFQRVDILVNGVGFVGNEVLMEALTFNEWSRVLHANLSSVFLCSRAVIPVMRERGYGRIVNISSNAGKDCNAYQSAYSAAKAGGIGLMKSLGRELVGILVNCITPGADRHTHGQDAGQHDA